MKIGQSIPVDLPSMDGNIIHYTIQRVAVTTYVVTNENNRECFPVKGTYDAVCEALTASHAEHYTLRTVSQGAYDNWKFQAENGISEAGRNYFAALIAGVRVV